MYSILKFLSCSCSHLKRLIGSVFENGVTDMSISITPSISLSSLLFKYHFPLRFECKQNFSLSFKLIISILLVNHLLSVTTLYANLYASPSDVKRNNPSAIMFEPFWVILKIQPSPALYVPSRLSYSINRS